MSGSSWFVQTRHSTNVKLMAHARFALGEMEIVKHADVAVGKELELKALVDVFLGGVST